ncbi:MAG: ASKHA domain-containing protein [Gemmatimonadales bacterium]
MIDVTVEARTLEAQPGLSLFECAERLELPVTNSCQSQGTCRECIVEVTDGADILAPRTDRERHLHGQFRLACQAVIQAPQGKVAFRRLRRGDVRILETAHDLPRAQRLPTLDPAVTRDGGRVCLEGTPIAQATDRLYGLALDIGTTTVVVRLVDLETGRVTATQSFENPQCYAGSDVMARIAAAAGDADLRLQKTLIAYINQAVRRLPCPPSSIFEITVAGNPTMRDLLFNLDVQSLGQSPYRSTSEIERVMGIRAGTHLTAPAHDLGLTVHSSARAYGMPIISSHVGADAAACLLAIDAPNEDRLIALMDIGTNTEIVIGSRRRMLAASCPAGPAFEGGTITCGLPAFPGAIERVRLDSSGVVDYDVVGDGDPQGICGSGLVDALAELLRAGRMNSVGRIGADRFVLDADANIYLTEQDISRLAQAKAANAAGWRLITKAYGATYGDIERLYLAGGFANHLDIAAAIRIGLIPPVPRQRIQPIGNAAIEGATLALQSLALRRAIEAFADTIEHFELETDEDFFDAFVEGCQFKPL